MELHCANMLQLADLHFKKGETDDAFYQFIKFKR